jgi:tetratricopeptide (TPR) repeat protein
MKNITGHKTIATVLIFMSLMLCSCSGDPQNAKVKYLAAGQNYMKKGQYGDATIEFRNALRLDPRFVEAYYQLAQADAAQHTWSGAYAALEKTIELDPNRLDARLDRGRLYLAAKEFGKAEEDANLILKQDPKDLGAYQLLGAALVSEGKPGQALAAFSKATELQPNDGSNYVNMALVELTLHSFGEAEEHFKKAVQLSPNSVQTTLDLANFYQSQNKLPEAGHALQTGIQNNPDAPAIYIDWAEMLSKNGQAADADKILGTLRTRMPKSAEAAISLGDYYLQRHDSDKALTEFRRGLSTSANNLDIEKRMEDVYLVTNQTEQAAQIDGQLMKLAPKDVLVRVGHGRLLMAQGKLQDAQNELQGIVKDAADSSQAHYYLGLSYWQKGSLGQATSELQEALRLSPGSYVVLQSLAQLNLSQGNATVAQTYGQELVQKYPGDVTNRLMLGVIYSRENQFRPAEAQFLAAKRLAPNQAAVHLNLGQLYSAEKKWAEAEKELETATQLDPLNPTLLGQYASLLVTRRESPKAVECVQKFVNANPTNAQGHVILGELQLEAKNNSAAQAEFERAVQLDPKNIQAYLRMGKVYQVGSQTELAIEQYQKALDLQPKLAPLCTMIGNLYLHRGDLETAREYFQKALDGDPEYAIAMANMAWVDALEGKNLNVALGMAQKAKALIPDLPAITDTLAWVMYMKGDYADAMPLLQECIQKAPNAAEFRYHLGMTLLAVGKKAEGKQELEVALRMKLDSVEANQAQQALAQAN